MKAWHFLRADKKLGYGDNRKVVVGETYEAEFPCNGYDCPTLGNAGMHGSIKIMDALSNAPGPIICRVDITGDVVEGWDKIVGRNREVLAMIDGTEILRKFARLCALDVARLWEAPEVVIKYLQTGEEAYRTAAWGDAAAWAARAAARDATWGDAAWAARAAARTAVWAARAAAWDAAWGDAAAWAARAAAWDAAWDATWGDAAAWAVRAAARDAAWDAAAWAAREAAKEAAKEAAWDAAAWAAREAAKEAAWDAAWEAQNKRLTQMVKAVRVLGGE